MKENNITLKCPKCKEVKSSKEFNRNKRRKNGFNGYCKEHQSVANKLSGAGGRSFKETVW